MSGNSKTLKMTIFQNFLECFGEKLELNSKSNESYVIEIWVGFLISLTSLKQIVSFQN